MGFAQAPLGGEAACVFVEELLGVDAVADERAAAEVVNEQVVGHRQLESGPPRPFGQVIIVEEAESEPFVESLMALRTGVSSAAEPRVWALLMALAEMFLALTARRTRAFHRVRGR